MLNVKISANIATYFFMSFLPFYLRTTQAIPRTEALEKVKSFRSMSLLLDQSAWMTRTSFLL